MAQINARNLNCKVLKNITKSFPNLTTQLLRHFDTDVQGQITMGTHSISTKQIDYLAENSNNSCNQNHVANISGIGHKSDLSSCTQCLLRRYFTRTLLHNLGLQENCGFGINHQNCFYGSQFCWKPSWENQLQISPRRFPKFLQSTFQPSKALSAPVDALDATEADRADFLLKSSQPDISQLGERPDNENLSPTLINSSANSLAVKVELYTDKSQHMGQTSHSHRYDGL